MGQYHKVINTTKKQFIHPHRFGDGLKLLEFGCSSNGTMTAVALLLARDNGRGSGDMRADDPIIGSWAGDAIVIAGDYGDAGVDVPDGGTDEDGKPCNLYVYSDVHFEDVSARVLTAMRRDDWIAESMRKEVGS